MEKCNGDGLLGPWMLFYSPVLKRHQKWIRISESIVGRAIGPVNTSLDVYGG
jgi:hypothetical protein